MHRLAKTMFCAVLTLSFLASSASSVMSIRAEENNSPSTASQSSSTQSIQVTKDSHTYNGSRTADPNVQGISGPIQFDWESKNADGSFSSLSEAPTHAGSYRVRARTGQTSAIQDSEKSKEGFSIPESVTLVINGTSQQQKASVAPVFTPEDTKAEVSYAVLTTRFNDDEDGYATVNNNLVADETTPRQSNALNDLIIAQIESKEISYTARDLFELNTRTGLITLSKDAVPQMRGTYYIEVTIRKKEQEITRLIPAHITTSEASGIEMKVQVSPNEAATSNFTYTIDSENNILYLPSGIDFTTHRCMISFYIASVPLNAPIPTSVSFYWKVMFNGLEQTGRFPVTNGQSGTTQQVFVFASPENYDQLLADMSEPGMPRVLQTLDTGEYYTIEINPSQYFPNMSWQIVFTSDGKPAAQKSALSAEKTGMVFIPFEQESPEVIQESQTQSSETISSWVEFNIHPFSVWGEDYQAAPEPISEALFNSASISVLNHDPLRENIDFTRDEGKTISSSHGSMKPGKVTFGANFSGKTYNPFLINDYTTYTDIAGNWWWNNPNQNWAQLATISGLMYGYTPSGGTGEFGPNDYINRAMAARIIWNMEGNPAPRTSSQFEDVPQDQYYTDAVAWCSEKGIIIGVGNNRYNPSAPVERQHFMKMLYRYAEYTQGLGESVPEEVIERYVDAGDVSSGNSHDDVYQAVNWALGNRIITGSGTSIKRIAPSSYATRMQAAKILTMASLVINGNRSS